MCNTRIEGRRCTGQWLPQPASVARPAKRCPGPPTFLQLDVAKICIVLLAPQQQVGDIVPGHAIQQRHSELQQAGGGFQGSSKGGEPSQCACPAQSSTEQEGGNRPPIKDGDSISVAPHPVARPAWRAPPLPAGPQCSTAPSQVRAAAQGSTSSSPSRHRTQCPHASQRCGARCLGCRRCRWRARPTSRRRGRRRRR